MATVTSLTDVRIQELLAGWEGIGLTQDEINALVIQLRTAVESQGALLQDWSETVKPQLEADLAAGSIRISELNDTTIPDLQASLAQSQLDLQNVITVDIPALQGGLVSEITNNIERPKVYVQPDEPTNPDVDERFLVVGDSWYDDDDNNKQRIWNGVEWTSLAVDIPNLADLILEHLSPEHALYKSPVVDATPVVNGANITPQP